MVPVRRFCLYGDGRRRATVFARTGGNSIVHGVGGRQSHRIPREFLQSPRVLALPINSRLSPAGLSASGSYGVRSPLFSFVATTNLIGSTDWVRHPPREFTAVPPRRLTLPCPVPDRRRRAATERPAGRHAPVRQRPGPSRAVPGYREKKCGSNCGTGAVSNGLRSVAGRWRTGGLSQDLLIF